ncbi:MAG: hypothetical protein ABI151_16145 [Chitinophagaceae bacterium]
MNLPKRWMRVTRMILKPALIVIILWGTVPGIWSGYRAYIIVSSW